ncbi:MAG TPA: asparagine synthase-related protein, partial [Candidatus Binatia bacterium]|nr:asparagine synthase-related protein [Candidatus Binatia bacterium]
GFFTYSWAYEQLTECDERAVSDAIAHHYGLPATHIPAEAAYPLSDYPGRAPSRDEPDVAAYAAAWERTMAEAQRQGVGTILTGGRGDLAMGMDVFGYLDDLLMGRWLRLRRDLAEHSRWLGMPVRKVALAHMLRPLKIGLWPPNTAAPLRQALQRLIGRPVGFRPLPDWIDSTFAERIELHRILEDRLPAEVRTGWPNRQRGRLLFLPSVIRVDTAFERVSARFGLEAADPWSDRRIVSFSAAVPQHVLNQPRERKRLVRRAMQDVVPSSVLPEMRKVSLMPLFQTALKEWARETVVQLTTESKAASCGFINQGKLRAYYEAYCRGEKEHVFFWYALTLEMWLSEHW